MRQLPLFILFFLVSFTGFGQYADQINSNRPGASIGAFSVGTRVIQFEAGADHTAVINTRHTTIQKSTGILDFPFVMDFKRTT